METTRPEGPTMLAPALDFAAEKAGRRALFVVLSDFLDAAGDEKSSLAALARLRSRRHDVLALQTLDREELDFPSTIRPAFSRWKKATPARSTRSRGRSATAISRSWAAFSPR